MYSGFPVDLFVLLIGVTYLFAIASNNGTVERTVHAARAAGQGPALADSVDRLRRGGTAGDGRCARLGRRRPPRAAGAQPRADATTSIAG